MRLKVAAALSILVLGVACASLQKSLVSDTDELKPRSSPLPVGEVAPDFTLEDQHNQKVTLSSARGKMPTVLVFYRGYW